jgi:hypothetical protein
MEPKRIPVRVQRRLRKTEVDVGPAAGSDQRRGNQVKTLIPIERGLLGVKQNAGRERG